MKLHRSTTIRVSLHESLTTTVQVTSSLNALTLASIALPLLALSVVGQTSPVNHLEFRGQQYSIKNQAINNTQ